MPVSGSCSRRKRFSWSASAAARHPGADPAPGGQHEPATSAAPASRCSASEPMTTLRVVVAAVAAAPRVSSASAFVAPSGRCARSGAAARASSVARSWCSTARSSAPCAARMMPRPAPMTSPVARASRRSGAAGAAAGSIDMGREASRGRPKAFVNPACRRPGECAAFAASCRGLWAARRPRWTLRRGSRRACPAAPTGGRGRWLHPGRLANSSAAILTACCTLGNPV